MSKPKITVIIPTRERCDVLEKSLVTITRQDYDNLDIIVSDNYSDDGTEEVVRSANDRRVKYINTGRRISMSHNWEFALSHVVDGWVTIIGDDDGLLPAALSKVVDIIKSTDTLAIRSKVCEYTWPSLTGNGFGRLSVPLTSGLEVRDTKRWLSKVINGQARYPELPMLYNGGFVRMSVLREIKTKTGAFYRSLTPDVYSALSIASAIDKYVYSNEPLAINGASLYSTGRSSFSKQEKDASSPTIRFSSEENIPFHKDLPLVASDRYPPSIQAIVYESYLQLGCSESSRWENMHSKQLEIILATSGDSESEIGEWGKLFANAHKLDFGSIRSAAVRRRFLLELMLLPSRILNAIHTYNIAGSREFPIYDVYDATLAAAAIRRVMPNSLTTVRQVIDRIRNKDDRN